MIAHGAGRKGPVGGLVCTCCPTDGLVKTPTKDPLAGAEEEEQGPGGGVDDTVCAPAASAGQSRLRFLDAESAEGSPAICELAVYPTESVQVPASGCLCLQLLDECLTPRWCFCQVADKILEEVAGRLVEASVQKSVRNPLA